MKSLTGRLSLVLASFFAMSIASAQSDEANARAVKLVTLHSFNGTDGWYPVAGLVQATNGDFYGSTVTDILGTIFKITPAGMLTTIYTVCGYCLDGEYPAAALVQATNGNLYGTTVHGGANMSEVPSGAGTVYKITPSGTLTTLYSFCGQPACADGVSPQAALVQSASGILYGTTRNGGAHVAGTIFKITPGGELTILYSFCSQGGCTDGEYPYAGLTQATNGDLYGTTAGGGTTSGCEAGQDGPGCGTIFKITPAGVLTTLYSFCPQSGCTDGANPFAGLVRANNGDYYGTTASGGAICPPTAPLAGCGTIFKITPAGAFTTLHRFCAQSGCPDGVNPGAALVQAASGYLYGTTERTIFRITPSGTLTTLYSFCAQTGCPDGQLPSGGVVQGTNGILYGTTYFGGANNLGTVFSLSTGEAPFVETRPLAGKVAEAVTILGNILTSATSVTFNGTPAAFTVVSAREITTTVPAGATTGKVEVVTPSGTLVSNVAFEVAP